MTSSSDNVLVVDLGAQYARLIARRIREARVHSEIVPARITASEAMARSPLGNRPVGRAGFGLLAGSRLHRSRPLVAGSARAGHLLRTSTHRRTLGAGPWRPPAGASSATPPWRLTGHSVLLEEFPPLTDVWMSHRDAVVEAPPGFRVTANTPGASVAAMENPDLGLYGVQFHPEVTHTPRGMEVLQKFLYRACGAQGSWTASSIIETQVDAVRRQVGESRAVCGLSGGVDSAVAAALVHRAIGDRLTCVFVDHGLLREGEPEQVEEVFGRNFSTNLVHVKAQARFLDALAGVTDPETKRKIIGETFIKVFEEVSDRLPQCRFLVQGTLYPDVIESGGGDAARHQESSQCGRSPRAHAP